MRKMLSMMSQGGLKGMPELPKIPQAAQSGGSFAAPGGKKRKKGGPWGLIKSR
jgi:hypothetical protein